MKMLSKGAVAVLALAVVAGGGVLASPASAAPKPPKPTPLQIAQSYMKPATTIPQKLPLKVKPTPGGKVAFIQQGASQTLIVGGAVKEAAESVGWQYVDVAYNPSNPATASQAITNALTLGATAIVVYGFDPNLLSQSVKDAAAQAKVPIHIAQVCPFTPNGVLFEGGGGCAAESGPAMALAAWFVADSKGAGHILLETNTTFPIYAYYHDQLVADIKSMCPKCVIDTLEITQAQATGNQVPSAVVARLRQDPSIKYVFFDSGTNAKGVASALDAAGLLSTTKVGGRSMTPDTQANLQNGQNVVWTANSVVTLGYEMMDAVLRVATKSSGINLDRLIPFQLVTTVNVNSVVYPYTVPANALALFKKLWRV